MSFVDILQRAEVLGNNHVDQKAQSSSTSGLKTIFVASGDICKKRQIRADLDWKESDLHQAESKPVSIMKKTNEPLNSANIALINEYIERSTVRAHVEAERAFINQCILENVRFDQPEHSSQPKQGKGLGAGLDGRISNQVAEHQQNLYAKHLSSYLAKDCQASIRSALIEAVKAIDERDVTQIWESVLPLLYVRDRPSDSSSAFRTSEVWVKHLLQRSTAYLQNQYKNHIENVIEHNLELARRGGIPGTLSLIEAYLNVTLNLEYEYHDGAYGKHPIWAVVYNCLRLGDSETAKKVIKNLQSIPNCSILVSCINSWSDTGLDPEKRMKLNAEWKHEASHCNDPYKHGCYAIFLGFDSRGVTDSIENWLWMKLIACKLDSVNGKVQFHKLQTNVCVDCGEDYFVSGDGNYFMYFTALWLTGQFERAIDVLFRAKLEHHAVHIALLTYQEQLLLISDKVSDPLLEPSKEDPVVCKLNYAKLVLLYTKNFELVNVEYALSYCFFLRFLTFSQDNLRERNIFESCVSRLCYLGDNTDIILGKLLENGEIKPGLIERFKNVIPVSDVVALVAQDSDVNGDVLVASKLYLLTGRVNDAFKLCSKHLANLMSNSYNDSTMPKEADETIKLAHWLEDLHTRKPNPNLESAVKMELDMLVKLNLFNVSAKSNPADALMIIDGLKLIPLYNDDLPARIADYVLVADQVKSVLHHVVLTLLEVFVQLSQSGRGPSRPELKQMVKVVLLFVAEINCRFPVHYNTKILQLQSQI